MNDERGLEFVPDTHHHQEHPLQLENDATEPESDWRPAVVLLQALITENTCVTNIIFLLQQIVEIELLTENHLEEK